MADDVAGSSALEVSADGSGFVAQLDRMTKAAETFERRAVQSAGKAGAAASGIGDGAAKAAEKADAASKRFTAAVEREVAALTLSRSEYRKWQAQQQGISESVYGPLIAKLEAAKRAQDAAAGSVGRLGDATELTSRQARLLTRNFGDAVAAIGGASGGPLSQAAQRVGQLGIAFGGFEGLGARITPLTAALGGVAAAAAVAAIAFAKGHAETEAYARALILSGNAAGTTTGQLKELAKAQSAIAGTQGEAAAVLAQLASSGDVAASLLGKATQAAIGLARVGGPAASETAKKFSDLGRDPVKAVERLNEAENFLTATVYKQIRALVEQGKTAEAAALAQSTYADAVIGRTGQLEQRLGIIERSWNGVKSAAKGAWDAMLNIGREQSLEERLAGVNERLSRTEEDMRLRARGGRRVSTQLQEREGDFAERAGLNRSLLNQTEGAIAAKTAAQEAKKAIADANKAIGAKVESPYGDIIRDLLKLSQIQDEELRTGGKVSEARKLQIRLIDQFADKAEKLTFAQRKAVAAEIAQRVAAQGRIEDLQKQVKAEQDYADAEAKAIQQQIDAIAREEEARLRGIASIDDRARKLQDEEEAIRLAAERNISLAEAIELVTIARLEEQAAASSGDPQRVKQINEEIDARQGLLTALQTKNARESAEKSAKEFQQAYERAYDQLSQGLTDALIQGGRSAADYLKGLFRNLVLRPLLQPFVGPIAGVLAGTSLGASAQGTVAQGAFGQAQQASTLFQAGKTIYDGFASGFSSVGGTAAGLYDAAAAYSGSTYGTAFGSQQSAMLAAQDLGLGGGATTGGTAFGSAASAAAGAAVGVYGGRAISGGYSAIGSSGNTAVNIGTAIGAIYGPIGAAIGGAIGGIVNRAFGRKAPEVTGRSIEGSISGSNFTGSTVTDVLEKGGLFRSDRRSQITEAITGDLDKALDEGAKSLSELAAKYGAALGLPAENLAGVTAQIKVKITDNADENSKAIAEALQQYADALLGSFAADVEPFRRSGETVAQTIERVGGTLLTVNQSLEQLGLQALATSIDGGKAATALADLFGDAGTFAQASATYYSKFYSEAERAGRATEQISDALGELGLTLPATRDDFRALVEAQDLTTDSGRQAFATLLGVSDAFDALRTAAGDSAQALAAVVEQRKSLETELLELQGNTVELRNRERDALDETNRALFDQVQALKDQKDAAKEATDAAEEAARAAETLANRQRSIASGVDSVVGDFLSGQPLATYLTTRINEILAAGGITGGTAAGIQGSTRADVMQLFLRATLDGREAILESLPLWERLQEVLRGTATAVAEYRATTLADQIEQARLGSLAPAARLAELRRQEAAGFAGLGSAADPVAAAQRLSNIISQRVSLEAQLEDNRGEALRKELETVERIRDVAEDAAQAAALMKFDDLSSLTRRDQLGAARSLFETTVARARAGDENALGNLVGNAAAFRQEAKTAFASSPAFAAIDALVTGTLEEFGLGGAGAASRATEIQQQLDALDGIDTSLGEQGALYQALLRIDATLAAAFLANPTAVTGTTGTVVMTGTNGVLTGITTTGTSATTLPTATTTVGGVSSTRSETLLEQALVKLDRMVAGIDGGNQLEQQQTVQTVAGLAAIEAPLADIARQTRLGNREQAAARV